MSQSRLFARYNKADATRAYHALEVALEEVGAPLAITEIDEANDIHEVSVYVENADLDSTLELTASALTQAGIASELAVETLPDIDWVAKSLEGLKPVRAGRFLVHGAHDRAQRRAGELAIEIEAGLAFGTGHHGTTSGCLEMLERVVRREQPRLALDLGTGSGVLGIAVAKLAHIPVLATDIDPIAVRVARDNARLNQTEQDISFEVAAGFHHAIFARQRAFDLIVANILAGPLMRLAPQMARQLRPGGSLILSGILDRQRNAVVAAYVGQNFRHVATLHREGWVTLHLKR
jgi:ribosomal protein L11 methyltransferase